MPFQIPFPLFNRWTARPEDTPATPVPASVAASPALAYSPSVVPSPSSVSSTPSTISAVQSQVRSLLQGSSIYAESPALSSHSTPKLPGVSIFHRGISTPRSNSSAENLPRESFESRSPLRPQYGAVSYDRVVVPSPQHGALIAPPAAYTREPASYEGVDPETAQLAILINQRARKQQRRAWVRRRNGQRSGSASWGVPKTPVRKKAMLCLGSGIFLAMVLTTYLSIALTHPSTRQEVHVLFILVILCTTILFCHSLVRLCMLSFRPQRADEQARIPDMAGPDGFQPNQPIRVHLARDLEDLGEEIEPIATDPEKEILKAPPPAYGLWRCSVPINPNLLHWQHVDNVHPLRQNPSSANPENHANGLLDPFETPRAAQRGGRDNEAALRPPSYVSDDGVRYVVEAEPRSVAPVADDTLSDVHPAYRGGLGIR